MAAADLPLDITHTILLNLCVKSLLRFKTVCKSWNGIISDPRFIKTHHQRFKNSNPHNLFICRRISEISQKNDQLSLFKFEKLKQLEFNELLQHPQGDVLCAGDGLVLLSNNGTCTDGSLYGLWNPSTGKHAPFWCPYRWINSGTIHGLCRDPDSENSYKVVIRSNSYYSVFSCKNKRWTKKHKAEYRTNTRTIYPKAGLYEDGYSFWISRDRNYNSKDIIYFDARDNEFKKLQRPKLLEGATSFFLTSLAGFLCAYDYTTCRTLLRMWIMKGQVDSYSWYELKDIEIKRTITSSEPLMPLMFFSKKEERVNTSMDRFEHIMSTTTIETIVFHKHGIRMDFPVAPYVESLFFPIQDSTRTKRKRSSKTDVMDDDDVNDDDDK